MDLFNKPVESVIDAATQVVHELAATRVGEGTVSLSLLHDSLEESGYLAPVVEINAKRKNIEHEPQLEAEPTPANTVNFPSPQNNELYQVAPQEQIKTAPVVNDEPVDLNEYREAKERAEVARQTISNIYPDGNKSEELDDNVIEETLDDIYGRSA